MQHAPGRKPENKGSPTMRKNSSSPRNLPKSPYGKQMFSKLASPKGPKPPSIFVLLPSLVVVTWLFFRTKFTELSPLSFSNWTNIRSARRFFNVGGPRQCFFVAMVITSEADATNGTMEAWFRTLPSRQRDRVCCVSIQRSKTTSFHFEESRTTCDTLYVPMVRDDEYLTISEKVQLGFSQVSTLYDFKWLLKTDADSFVCFSRILNLLANYDPEGVSHLGYAESRNILLEDPAHKWYDPSMTDIVHNARQPVVSGTGLYHPYMQGAGYVLSKGAMDHIQATLPSLRYSPMEDAMVGSWVLAFNAHWAVLDLDLRGERKPCGMPDHLYISHYRKGARDLDMCREYNEECTDLTGVRPAAVRDVAFLITSHMALRGNQNMDLYDSIRAIFPSNEILFGDVSESDEFMSRLLTRKRDPNLRGFSFPGMSISIVKNALVKFTKSPYVCVLQDVQRLSWETMIAKMLLPVQSDEAEITAGFLAFNPHMRNSSYGLLEAGYNFTVKNNFLIKRKISAEFGSPNDVYTTHGTAGFILTKTSLLRRYPWRDFGLFSDEEFYYRLYNHNIRIRLVNSGVRHGYHYPLVRRTETLQELKTYAPRMCAFLSSLRGAPTKMIGLNVTLDCDRRIFKKSFSNPNLTSLNLFLKW